MFSETNIISSDSLFTNDELDMLEQLNLTDDTNEKVDETIVEYKNGKYFFQNYHSNDYFDPNSNNLDISLEEDYKGETNSDWKLCPKCKVRLQDLGFATSECSKCGAEINKNSEEQDIKAPANGLDVLTSIASYLVPYIAKALREFVCLKK